MSDKWEVLRIYGDDRQGVSSFHKSAELADCAFAKAVASNDFYAVDVLFLVNGRRVDFEPIYGIANGFQWITHNNELIYSDAQLMRMIWEEQAQ